MPTRDSTVPIGLDAHRNWINLRFAGLENPHIFIAGGSQIGKTTLQIFIAALAASVGMIVVILDPKLQFTKPFRNPVTHEPLPHVLVYWNPDDEIAPQEWDGILRLLRTAMQQRYYAHARATENILKNRTAFPTVLFIVDEMGVLLDFADRDWDNRKPDKARGKTPVRENLHTLTRMGAGARFVGCFANQNAREDELPAGTKTRDLCNQRIFIGPINEGPLWRAFGGEGVARPDIPPEQPGASAILYGDKKPIRFQATNPELDEHPTRMYDLAARGIPLLRESGHIDHAGNLTLSGIQVPRPGQMADHVASPPDSVLPTPSATPASDSGDELKNNKTCPRGDVPDTEEASRSDEPATPHISAVPTPIVGNADAADFCGMSVPKFRRWNHIDPVPNKIPNYDNNKPAWSPDDLREWALRHSGDQRRTDPHTRDAQQQGA